MDGIAAVIHPMAGIAEIQATLLKGRISEAAEDQTPVHWDSSERVRLRFATVGC